MAFATLCVATLAAALGVIAVSACSTIPGTSTAWTVASMVERGAYLDVQLSRKGESQRFFVPANAVCRGMLHVEGTVEYVSLGPIGEFQQGETVCDPLGIGDLRAWRDSRPRPGVMPLPTGTAIYGPDYQDADLVMLRGRFPLTGLIGFPSMGDSIVVLPRTEPCLAIARDTVASIEYRDAGPEPFVLIGKDARCPLMGLIQPIPPGT